MSFSRYATLLEIVAVFTLFLLFGAWKVPDVNEAHYICKAIHFWNPNWIPNDPFLQSKDAHWTFYFVFGWLSFFCSPAATAWVGRITAWSLLAWSWKRLSFALIPVRGASVLTALALAFYIEYFNMAGEWLIGGIEGKSLAYPFVFFALEAMLRNRWNRAGIFLGIATALHVLVGGWATIIAAVLFFTVREPATVSPFPRFGIIIGGLFALCGLLPGLTLDSGTSSEITKQAHQIYAFNRLQHHLVPYLMKDTLVFRFALLTLTWILLCRHRGRKFRLFNAFIWGTLVLSAIGWIAAFALSGNKELSAEVLRFYWFRLADIAVPMGVAIGANWFFLLCFRKLRVIPIPKLNIVLSSAAIFIGVYTFVTYICFGYFKLSRDLHIPWILTMLILHFVIPILYACIYYKNLFGAVLVERIMIMLFSTVLALAPLSILPHYINLRVNSIESRTEPKGAFGQRIMPEWLDACQWIEKNTPQDAQFWVPRDGHTFKWYARRGDIGTWKNIPQDAESVVQWFQAMKELYRYKGAEGIDMDDRLITTLVCSKSDEELTTMQKKYGFDYILCVQSYEMPKQAALELVYQNEVYCLYRYNIRQE